MALEIFDNIIEKFNGYPISMEEGLRMRKEFMNERREFQERHTKTITQYAEWDFYGEPGTEGGGDAV